MPPSSRQKRQRPTDPHQNNNFGLGAVQFTGNEPSVISKGTLDGVATDDASFNCPATKRRKRDIELQPNSIPSGSTVSPDQTTSPAPHTTALPSLLSNSQTLQLRFIPHDSLDDDDGHYIVTPNADLTHQYQIVKSLGQGTFGKVVEAKDRENKNKAVAIKIIRSVDICRNASIGEIRVLVAIKQNDAENHNQCVRLRDCFIYGGHVCIVMDLLGQSVFDFLKVNGFVPFPNSQIRSFARQLFTSTAFLHGLDIIHTDLKPENIVLCDSSYQTFTYNRNIPSSSKTSRRRGKTRKVLLDTNIRLIDFGSATFQDEDHSPVATTRPYRAPEIILGLGWSFPCDIWSIGCILVEFYTGKVLFQPQDNVAHLAMMETVVDRTIDSSLVESLNRMANSNGGNAASKYFKGLQLDYPTPDTTRASKRTRVSKRVVRAMKRLEVGSLFPRKNSGGHGSNIQQDFIPLNTTYYENFLDLLRKIFVYDPQHRITAKQALEHPWFKQEDTPDDGTEAEKIRIERIRNIGNEARGRN
ncbi:protein kinase [Colletotrichum musicola]|uniref:Protein kinase n=1 Tax=Colletotrichum musicola TaxID=2175873 RepID=A0A8H6JS69_9PEZI|nr:protein kinase [Colletotrichum musicola]